MVSKSSGRISVPDNSTQARRLFLRQNAFVLTALSAGVIGLVGCSASVGNQESLRSVSFSWTVPNLSNQIAAAVFRLQRRVTFMNITFDLAFSLTSPSQDPAILNVRGGILRSTTVPTGLGPEFSASRDFGPAVGDNSNSLTILFDEAPAQDVFCSAILVTDPWNPNTSRSASFHPMLPAVIGEELLIQLNHRGSPGDAQCRFVIRYA